MSVSDFRDLMGRIPGSYAGTWYLIPNEKTLSVKGKPWSEKAGKHPFVLLGQFDQNLPVPVRGRSGSDESQFVHEPHPWRHEDTCCITKRGWIRAEWSLPPEVICDEYYSCIEPDEEITKRLQNGEGP